MEENKKRLLLRLSVCAFANIVLLGLIVFLGRIAFGNFIVYKNILLNVFFVFFIGLLICTLWIFAYVCLDAVQREPLKNILLVFAFAVVLQFFFESLLKFIAKNPYVFPNSSYRGLFNFVCNALSSLLAIMCVFKFLVLNFKDFDEAVDTLIYGGVAGVGIAFCSTLTSVFIFQSVSFDFVLLNFTVRISLLSCAAALAGFLLYDALQGKNYFAKIFFAYILIMLILGVSVIVEARFSQGMFVQPQNRTLVAFCKTSIFCIAVFSIIVALVFIQLKKTFVPVQNKFCIVDGAILFFVFALAVFTRIAPDKNEKFILKNAGNGKNYSFELPFGFVEYKDKSMLSLFEGTEESEPRYVNKKTNDTEVQLIFGTKTDSEMGQKKWAVVSDSWEKQDGKNCYKFFIADSNDNVEIDVFMAKSDDAYANKIVKTLLKTLEAE